MNTPAPPVWHPPGPIGFQGRHRGRVARFFVPEFMNSGVFLAPTGGTLLSFSGNGEFLPPAAFSGRQKKQRAAGILRFRKTAEGLALWSEPDLEEFCRFSKNFMEFRGPAADLRASPAKTGWRLRNLENP